MANYTLNCQMCGTVNEISATALNLKCGIVSSTFICKSCNKEADFEKPYWRWLELEEAPADEEEEHQVR